MSNKTIKISHGSHRTSQRQSRRNSTRNKKDQEKESPKTVKEKKTNKNSITEKMKTLKKKTEQNKPRSIKRKVDTLGRVHLKKPLKNKESNRMIKKFTKMIPYKNRKKTFKETDKKIKKIKQLKKKNPNQFIKPNRKLSSIKKNASEQNLQLYEIKKSRSVAFSEFKSHTDLTTAFKQSNIPNSKSHQSLSKLDKVNKLGQDERNSKTKNNPNSSLYDVNNKSFISNEQFNFKNKMNKTMEKHNNQSNQKSLNRPLLTGKNVEEMISQTCLLGIPSIVYRRVDELRKLQIESTYLEHELQEKMRLLLYEYHLKSQKIYDKRHKIVKGNEKQKMETRGIPLFWLKVLLHHPFTRNLIMEHDEYALRYLDDLRVKLLKNNPGFSLHFFFSPNPYFENEVLTKVYHLSEEIGMTNNLFLERTEGTKIIWKSDKQLNIEIEEITKRSVSTGKCKTYRKKKPCKSFFNFFKGLQITEFDREDDIFEIQTQLEADFEIGNIIKDTIVPLAVLYFSGEALSLEDVLSNSSSVKSSSSYSSSGSYSSSCYSYFSNSENN
ncbi:hypothetical protein M0812_14919 [Anaeramoeba flamelloides]|uniref:Nucleosome assembly protein n=1 Tax=Anaeramoeba flamelloides TaxID=1746091 RepID=A0AAV7ZCP9_9EUKA|nr:hypothetical protein M0812_14919 [Anaeramoeba flamelloides]